MSRSLTASQVARVRACEAVHGAAIEAALGDYPSPHDRMADLRVLEDGVRAADDKVAFLVAWLQRVLTDETVRPLSADLEVRWPAKPDADDVALVATLASDPNAWYYEVRAALTLAERVLDAGPAPAALVDGLLALRARLEDDRLHSSEFFRAKALPWLLRLVARTTPDDMVDLAFVDHHDAWAPAVADVVAAADDPAATARALLHLGSPRGGKASKTWWATTQLLVDRHPGLPAVADDLLEAVTAIDATARDDHHDGWDVPDPFLLTPTNELVARGLVWMLRVVPADDARCDRLGRVALRTASMTWVVPAHRMLCPKLASATVDTLMALDTGGGSPGAHAQLEAIIDEVRVPVLIKRIGAHLGHTDAEVKAMVKALRDRGPLPRPDR